MTDHVGKKILIKHFEKRLFLFFIKIKQIIINTKLISMIKFLTRA
jgi:hypothetical protein